MKLLRHQSAAGIVPAMLDADGKMRSLAKITSDLHADKISPDFFAALGKLESANLPLIDEQANPAPCLAGIRKVIAIGKNYPEHAKEIGTASPTEPIIFMKATSSITGANNPIYRPRASEKLDWEVELGVIIGIEGSYIPEGDAMRHVAGYCTANDVSERAFQTERSGQWTKGKSADGFCPLGPCFVTADSVPNPQNMRLWCAVNGVVMQDGTTADMTFKIPFLIHYLSQFMRLEPGDVILTGTPAGVGKGRTPPLYLQPGDILRCEVEGLGVQEHKIMQA